MKRYLISILIIFSFFIFIFIYCKGLEQIIQPPDVRIVGVRLPSISFESITLDFDIAIDNPNPFGISINKYDYRFLLENNQLFASTKNDNIIINAKSSNHINIPLTLVFKEIYNLFQNTKNLDSLNYHFEGHITPGGVLSTFTIPFSKTGRLPNIRIPAISIREIKMNRLSLSGVDLELVMNVKNPNSFGFNIGKFNYAIQLKGTPVASGIGENLASIPEKGPGEIRLPLKIDFSGAAASLYSALTAKTIDCSISGGLDINSSLGSLSLPISTQTQVSIFK